MPYDEIRRHRRRTSLVFLITGLVLAIGWPISAWIDWNDIITSHTRLGYLIGDICLAVPLCLISYRGLQREAPWGPSVSLLAIGALAYDTIHFGIFLIQEQFLNIPLVVYLLLILGILYVLYRLAIWEIRLAGVLQPR